MRTIEQLETEALAILDAAIARWNPVAVFAGFSGGKDSLAAITIASQNERFTGAFHANTGIGIEETRQYVRDYCETQNWNLVEIRAKEDCGQDYDEIVKKLGFPGPALHCRMYQRLKERPIQLLKKRYKQHRLDKIVIVTGAREHESARRMVNIGNIAECFDMRRSIVWTNVIQKWTTEERNFYIRHKNLETNPVSELLCMSGECLCGAFAKPGELERIKSVCLKTHDRIVALEKEVRENPDLNWGWEEAPPRKPRKSKATIDPIEQPFCTACITRNDTEVT